MKRADDTVKKLQAMLENLELPAVQMPAHQRRLREALLASGYHAKEGALLSAHSKNSGGINKMKPKRWKLAVSFAVLFLVVGVYTIFFAPPRAVASLALQVNPALTLTISGENTVINAEGLDARGEALLTGLDVTGKEMQEVLRIIAGALHEAGLLGDERRILVALYPVGDRAGEAGLTTMADLVRQALSGYLAEHGLVAEVTSVVLTAELADAVRAAGLFPAGYVDLVAAVGSPMALEVLNLQKELDLDLGLFKEEFGTITAALLDMVEAGIAGDNALAILKGTLAADPQLQELTTITAAMIDLHEAGATQEEMISVFALLEEQIAAGVDRALLLEEITTITAAKIDLLEAGVPAATALAVLRAALAADPKLEELTTITAAMIDLTEEGLSKEEALVKIQAAIKADPTLQQFYDLLEIPGKEEADEAAEPGELKPDKPEPKKPGQYEPKPDKPQADKPEADKPQPGKPRPDKPEPDKPEPDKPEAEAPGGVVDGAEPGKPQPGKPQAPVGVPGNRTDEE
jgi:hypothetical protein